MMTNKEISDWVFLNVLPDDLTIFDCVELGRKLFPYRVMPNFGYHLKSYKLWLKTIMDDMLRIDSRLYEDVCYWAMIYTNNPTLNISMNTPSKSPVSQSSSRAAPRT